MLLRLLDERLWVDICQEGKDALSIVYRAVGQGMKGNHNDWKGKNILVESTKLGDWGMEWVTWSIVVYHNKDENDK